MYDVESVDIHYLKGGMKRKPLIGKHNYKAWEYVKRLIKKKAFQDASDDHGGVDVIKPGYNNKGVGDRYKWRINGTEVYHPGAAAVVEKHYHMYNAMLIFPDSWVDKQLQKAYSARKSGPKKENNEQKDTPKRANRK
jgi:hypothetical protein